MGDVYAIITAVCWSSAVILFDVSTKKFEAIQLNALKNFIGVVGFIATIIIFSLPAPNFSGSELLTLFISGILGILIADALFLESLRRLGSGLSAVVSTIYSPAIFIIAFVLYNETISLESYFGGFLVVSGIAISVYKVPKNITRENLYVGIVFGIFANILTAYSVLIVKPVMVDNSIVYVALYRFSVGLLTAVFICIVSRGLSSFIMKFKEGLSNKNVLFGSFLGTYLSVIFWLAGYKYTLAGKAAIYNQLSTVFIILLARYFLNEAMTTRKTVGVTLAIVGAILVGLST